MLMPTRSGIHKKSKTTKQVQRNLHHSSTNLRVLLTSHSASRKPTSKKTVATTPLSLKNVDRAQLIYPAAQTTQSVNQLLEEVRILKEGQKSLVTQPSKVTVASHKNQGPILPDTPDHLQQVNTKRWPPPKQLPPISVQEQTLLDSTVGSAAIREEQPSSFEIVQTEETPVQPHSSAYVRSIQQQHLATSEKAINLNQNLKISQIASNLHRTLQRGQGSRKQQI